VTTRPLLCLVTDRRRLADALSAPPAAAHDLLLRQIEGAVAGRVDLVQIRERDLEAGELLRIVREAVAIAAGSVTRVVVNDRADVAIAADAAGVHLRESSLSAADVRRLSPGLLVGRSVHDARSAALAGPLDYLLAGSVFPTRSKPGARGMSVARLADIVVAANGVPVLAIGGVTTAVVRQLAGTGLAGVAAIGAFIPDGPVAEVCSQVEKSANELRFAFDTGSAVL
jgi:thiamine-phosphate diphosphorylase